MNIRMLKTLLVKIVSVTAVIGFLVPNVFPVQTYFLQVAEAATGVPKVFSYQGRLTDASGNLLGGAGTNYDFKFSIWDSANIAGGIKLWPPGPPSTVTLSVAQGVFNVNIGDSGYPDPLTFDFNSTDTAFLQVQVFNTNTSLFETLSPRQQIMSSGYAINSSSVAGKVPGTSANNILALDNSGNINIAGQIISSDKIQGGSGLTAGTALLINTANTYTGNLIDLQVNGSSKFSVTQAGNATVPGTLTVTTTGSSFTGTVGVGTLNATAAIQTSGSTRIDASGNLTNIGNITGTLGVTIASTTNTLTLDSGNNILTVAASDTTLQRTAAGTYTVDLNDGSATTLSVNNSGAGVANLNLVDGGLQTGSVTRISNAGAGTLVSGTVIGSQTFTTNNIVDSGSLTIKSAAASNITLDSGTTGAIGIGNTSNADSKTITIGNTAVNTTIALTKGSGGNITLTGFDCTGFSNNGKLTADASGNISCANDSAAVGGSGSESLQDAYALGNTISTTGSDIAFTLNAANKFSVTTAAGATNSTQFVLADGSNATPPAQLVLIKNNDTNQALAAGLTIQSAAGGITNALDLSGSNITNAISLGNNKILGADAVIDFNNFDVASNGNLIAGTYNGATITGGSLSGVAVNGVTTANIVLTTGSYANPAWITSLDWSKINSTPTTLGGYGITDALSNSATSTQDGHFSDIFLKDDTNPSHYLQITAGSDLTAARSLTIVTGDASRILTLNADATLSGTNSGDVTLAGENYLTIAGQVITAHPVDLSGTNATGTLAAGRFGALTGDVTNVAGSYATTIANNAVTSGKILDNTIVNLDLASGSFTNITGVGTLAGLTVTSTSLTGNQVAFTDNSLTTGTLQNISFTNDSAAAAGNTATGLSITENAATNVGNTSNLLSLAAGANGTVNGINISSATGFTNFLKTPSIIIDSSGNITGAGTIDGATLSGGSLSAVAVNGVTTANIVVTSGSYSDPAWIASLNWSKITATPTTLGGYGITDALSNSSTSTQDAHFGDVYLKDDVSPSHYLQVTDAEDLTGARSLSIIVNDANRTLTVAGNTTISGTNTGDVALAGENFLTISGQTITAHPVDLSGTNATGTLAAGRFGALTGDVTNVAGSYATTIANSAVTSGKILDNTIAGGDLATNITFNTTGAIGLNGGFTGAQTLTADTSSEGAITPTANLSATGSINGITITPTKSGTAAANTYTINAFNAANVAGVCPGSGAVCVQNALNIGTGYTNYIKGANLTIDSSGNFTGGTINTATISGGSLTTTAVNGITTANIVLTTGSYSDPAWITGLAWSKISGTPTTLGGYGITDALSNSSTSTQDGHFGDVYLKDDTNPSHYLQITNAEDLSGARSLSIVVNDADRTLTIAGNASLSGTNTGDNATNTQYSGLAASKADVGQTFYIGTTQVAINRASAALTLAGITLTTPDLGTPTTLVGTNITGTAAGLTAGAVTNGVYTTDTGSVTSTMILNGTILAADLSAGAVTANKLQSAAADLGAADVTVNLSNTNGGFNTNITTDGSITAGSFVGPLTGNASTATTATNATNGSTVAVSNNATYFPAFFASSTNGNQPFNLGAGLTFNPSTNNLSTTTFTGALSGNATTATSATTAGTVTTAAQPSITSVGTLTGLTVTSTGLTGNQIGFTDNVLTTGTAQNISFTNDSSAAAGNTATGLSITENAATNVGNTSNLLSLSAGANGTVNGINIPSATGFTNFLKTPTAVLSGAGALSGLTGLTVTSGGEIVTAGDVAITAGNLTLGGNTRITNAGVGTFANTTVVGTDTFGSHTITDSGALTVASTTNDLTLDSGSNILQIAATDTTLQRIAAGTYTFDLKDGSNTVLALTNSGAGAANLLVDGLSGNGVRCLQTDNLGNISVAGAACGAGGASSLQTAYNTGNTISTSGSPIAFTLNTSDKFTVTTAAGGTGDVEITLADGSNATPSAQLLLVKNSDTTEVVAAGISVQAAAGGITTAFDASGSNITNALAVGTHTIAGTGSFSIDLVNGSNDTLTVTDSGAGTASLSVEGGISLGTFAANSATAICSNSGTLSTCSGITDAQISDTLTASVLTANYVANAATASLTGLAGGSAGSNAASLSLSIDESASTIAGDFGLTLDREVFATNGIIFEGHTADANETLLTVTDPTADQTITIPNRSGTISLSGDTFTTDVTGTLNSTGATALTIAGNAVTSGKILDNTIAGGDLATNITFNTTGAIGLNGGFTSAQTLTVDTSSEGLITPTQNLSATGSVNGLSIAPVMSGAAAGNTYTTNAFNAANVSGSCGAGATCVENALNIGTGYTNFLKTGSIVINSSGAISGATGLTLTSGNITTPGNISTSGTGTISVGAFAANSATAICSNSGTLSTCSGITDAQISDTLTASVLTANYVASVANGTGITGGGAGSNAAALTLGIDLTAGLTWTGAETFTPSGTNNLAFNLDADSTFTAAQTIAAATDPSSDAFTLNLNHGGNGVTGTTRGLVITQNDTATVGAYDTLAYIQNKKTPEVTTNGLLIEENGASGTLSNALHITNTAGTLTTAILIDGTAPGSFILDSASLDISGAGAITGATGLTLTSGNITTPGNISTTGTGTISVGTFAANSATAICSNSGTLSTCSGITDAQISDTLTASVLTANYVANAATASLTGLAGGSAGSNAASLSLSLDESAATSGDLGLAADREVFGASGIIFEGSGADANETFLQVTNPTGDRTVIIPDRGGTFSLSGDTFTTDVTGTLNSTGATALTIAGNAVNSAKIADGTIAGGDLATSITISTTGSISTTSSGTITSAGLITATSGVSIAAGQSYSGAGAVILSSGASGNVTISPNGSGNLIFNPDADTNLQITANGIPVTNMVAITNSGQAIVTANANGLSINYTGGAAAVEAAGQRIDLTPGSTAAGTWDGLRVVTNTTGPVAQVTENSVKLEGPTSITAGGIANAIEIKNPKYTTAVNVEEASTGIVLNSPFGGIGHFENYLKRSEEFDQSDWAVETVGVTVTADQVAAPDGTTTADKLADNATAGTRLSQSVTSGNSTTWTFSVWIKNNDATGTVKIGLFDNSLAGASDVNTITIATPGTDQWQRYSVTHATAGSGVTSVVAAIDINQSNSTRSMYIWGAQVDKQSSPGVYNKTMSSALAFTGSNGLVVDGNLNNVAASDFIYGSRINERIISANAGTHDGLFIRIQDDTSAKANTVRGLEVQAWTGTETSGTNIGVDAYGKTFGISGTTDALAGGVSAPAAVFAYLQNTSATNTGNALRAYSDKATGATLVSIYQESSAFTGVGLEMNIGNTGTGAGSFLSGNFLSLKNANTEKAHIDSSGNAFLNLAANLGTHAVCQTTVGSSTNTNAQIGGCSGSPVQDYAEIYPTSDDVNYADIVTVGTQNVATTDGLSLKQMVKSTTAYDSHAIGIASDNHGDFSSTGYVIADSDHPMPVALNGRVPVKFSAENGEVVAGDFLTTSGTVPGAAMKATGPGWVIGKAIAAPINGTVLVFVHATYNDPTTTIDENNNIIMQRSDTTAFVATSSTTAALIDQKGSGNLLQVQSNEINKLLVKNNGELNINVTPATDTDNLVVVKSNDAEVFSINARGQASFAGNIFIKDDSFAGSIATDANGDAQIDFTYDLGTGKPDVQLTVEGETPAFAQVGGWLKDNDGNYIGFKIKTFAPAGGAASAIVHYLVVGKEAGYDTKGNVVVVSAATPIVPVPDTTPPTPAEITPTDTITTQDTTAITTDTIAPTADITPETTSIINAIDSEATAVTVDTSPVDTGLSASQ